MKLHFITYGDEKFERARKRLCKQAEDFNFDTIIGYTSDDVSDDYKETFEYVLSKPRGGGYWLWKWILIEKRLKEIERGDILVYIDSGCILNKYAISRFNEYIEILRKSPHDFLSFQLEHLEYAWTTKEIYKYFNYRPRVESGQLIGGVVFIKNTLRAQLVVNRILTAVEHDNELITDYYTMDQHPDFIENRHDQSISSVARKIYGTEIISDETYFGGTWGNTESLKYPIWAMRLNY